MEKNFLIYAIFSSDQKINWDLYIHSQKKFLCLNIG